MHKLQSTLAAILLLMMALPAQVGAQSWSQAGMLNCTMAPSVGLILGSQQRMTCRFTPNQPYPPQDYVGVMNNIGIDLGVIAGGALAWAVLSQTIGTPIGSLAGTYVGASGEITAGLGVGANVLVGGSARNVALQPLSVQGTAGINVQLGVSGLELRPAP